MGRHSHWKWFHYYWNLFKCVGSETYKTWRWELFASVPIGFFVALLNGNWKDFRTASLATAMTLGCFIVWHVLRVPWLLFKSVQNEESHSGTLAGIFGVTIIAAVLFGGIELGRVLWEARPLGVIDSKTKAPQVTIENPRTVKVPYFIAPPDEPPKLVAYRLQGQMNVNGHPEPIFVLVGLTNKPQQNLSLKIICQQDIQVVSTHLDFGRTKGLSIGNGYRTIDSKSLQITIGSEPLWTKDSPFFLSVGTLENGLSCDLTKD